MTDELAVTWVVFGRHRWGYAGPSRERDAAALVTWLEGLKRRKRYLAMTYPGAVSRAQWEGTPRAWGDDLDPDDRHAFDPTEWIPAP